MGMVNNRTTAKKQNNEKYIRQSPRAEGRH